MKINSLAFFFLIVSTLNAYATTYVSDRIKSINIGPGTGEYVYALTPKYDSEANRLNMYPKERFTHAQNTLNYLQTYYPNVQNINLIIGWFGDTNISSNITIQPLANSNIKAQGLWNVGQYNRENAALVSLDDEGVANWGGTPDDASIIEFARTLKKLGYRVTLYPMLFIDAPGKPWRGNIKFSTNADIEHFYEEYKKFPLHYVNLEVEGKKLLDYIDEMIIASEFVSFTQFKNEDGNFPGVFKLIELAGIIKEQSKGKLKLTYSANWSEYHHAEDCSFPLDNLWASKHIDYVGIDAYFPLTDPKNSDEITSEQIIAGWESGENYDYYLDRHGNHKHLKPEYAIQNVEWWWKNKHKNPDGSFSEWQPKMKPIVFTEVGFPSVDRTTNDPASYYDPKSNDENSTLPRGSKGMPNYEAQLLAIKATEDFWDAKNKSDDNFGLVARRDYYYVDVRYGYEKFDRDGHKFPYGHNLKISMLEKE